MRKNNKGMSYVELLLVLAIMAILIAVASLTIGLISRANVSRGAEKLASTFNQARSVSMARGTSNGVLEITFDGSNYYYYVGSSTDPDKEDMKVKFISSPAVVTYALDSAPTTQIPMGTMIKVEYDQSSGSIKRCIDASGNVVSFHSITLTNEDKSATIRIYSATGKCDLVY